VLEYIKQHYPEIPVVIISGYYDENMRELIIEKGAKDVWKRCIKLMRLLKRFKRVLSS
jgi:DNA-binding NtrC family response regulator